MNKTTPKKKTLPAWKSTWAISFFIAVCAAGVAADLLSKHYAFSTLMGRPNRSLTLIDGVLRFRLSTNPGIVFGFRSVPGWVVLAATFVAMGSVVALFATSEPRQWGVHAALAMVFAGAAGNAYDRLFSSVTFPNDAVTRIGEVRDFIDVYVIRYPIFNVADILLVVGVGLIILATLRRPKEAS